MSARSVALRRGLPHPRHVVGRPPSEACQRCSQLWMNIHGGAAAPTTRRCDKMCACWSGPRRPAACWPPRHPQMSWPGARVSLSAAVMSHDTSGPPDWPPQRSGSGPHLDKPKRSRDITARPGGFRGDEISIVGKRGCRHRSGGERGVFALNAETLPPKVRQTSKFPRRLSGGRDHPIPNRKLETSASCLLRLANSC